MTNKIVTDFLVLGSGPGASVAAYNLSKTGKKVLVVEQGDYVTRKDFSTKIGEMTSKYYKYGGANPIMGAPSFALAEANCLGGGSTINGALMWKTPKWILDEWETLLQSDKYSFNNLKKVFDIIEDKTNVTVHELEEKSNLDSLVIHEAATKLGWKKVMVPRAVKNCINENLCATGCPSGGKQSMIETYIPSMLEKNVELMCNHQAIRIKKRENKATSVIVFDNKNKVKKEIEFDKLIVGCGAVSTPFLLKKSNLINKIQKLSYHWNIKVVAEYDKVLNADKGTLFTVQVQEYEKEGLLMMGSGVSPNYISSSLSHFGNKTINEVQKNFDKSAIYVSMIKPDSKAKIHTKLGPEPFLTYKFNKRDRAKIEKGIIKIATLLFEAGAKRVFLPIKGSKPFNSISEVEDFIPQIKISNLELISVHCMSSCKMGSSAKNSVVDINGKLWNYDNVWVVDASVLPTNIGESPQETIMAFSHVISEQITN
jgi:choline dehydrogenase-like flavoprotein